MEKGQSKLKSFAEANVNTLIGFLVTLTFSPAIYKLVGMQYTPKQLGMVTFLFTILSVVRGYVIRRFFNKQQKSKDEELLSEIRNLKRKNLENLSFATSYEKLYISARSRLSKLQTEVNDFIAFIGKHSNKEEKLVYNTLLTNAYFDAISDIVNQIKARDKKIENLKEEISLCKDLHRIAVSDLVEGADYHHGESAKSNIEENANNSPYSSRLD